MLLSVVHCQYFDYGLTRIYQLTDSSTVKEMSGNPKCSQFDYFDKFGNKVFTSKVKTEMKAAVTRYKTKRKIA